MATCEATGTQSLLYQISSSTILAENQSYTETQSSSLRKLCVNPPDHISSPLVSIQCFSLQLCSSCACDVLYVFVVIQPRSSVSISSIADIVQSKTRDNVIFTDLWIHYSRDLSLRLYRRLPRLFLLSGFINSSYSQHVAVAACAKGIYLFLHHFFYCPCFSIVEDD